MKNLLKSFAILLFVPYLFACSKHHDCVPSPSKCGTGKTIIVKVDNAICGNGVWGNLWFLPKDSLSQNPQSLAWLQPYSLEKGVNYSPKVGDYLQISYQEAKTDNRYDGIINCLAYPGKSTPIHIFCIQPLNSNPTQAITQVTKTLKVFMSCSGTGVFGEKWLYDETTNTYLQPCKWIGNSQIPTYDDMEGTNLYEVVYAPSASKECQDNYNINPTKSCLVAPPKATPIDIWAMKKIK